MDTIKLITLGFHNILRWVVLGLGVLTMVKMYSGWLKKNPWTDTHRKFGLIFTIALDTQLTVGFLLYFVFSDLVRTAFADFGSAMTNPTLRFFSVEHITLMLIAIALGHIAASVGKKDLPDQNKFKRSAFLFSFSLLLIILGIPWSTRPWLPGL